MSKNYTVCDTKSEKEPVGAVFNVEKNELERYIRASFNDKGLTGISGVELRFKDNGRIVAYLFLFNNSNGIVKPRTNAPKRIQHKVGNDMYLSQLAKDVLNDFTPPNYSSGPIGNEYYVELDIFSCLGDYLAADPENFRIRISESAKTTDGKYIMTVIKQSVHSIYNNHVDDDSKHAKAIDRLERNRY